MRSLAILILWVYSINLVGGATNALAVRWMPLANVVRQYALTSANDFPLRDPQDWCLLASNDGGKTWVTLDKRTGEIFSERHQRRVFHITNSVAFNLYRLQIDRVRDPAAANAVQLAEIEPMGETENDLGPTPIFADAVTAQGENPPFELSRFAFDGRQETKWLDQASQFPKLRSSWIQWQYSASPDVVVKNVQDLLSLRSKANNAYRVEIDGVVIGRLPGTNGIYFMDATGQLKVYASREVAELFPGQRVFLKGKSAMIDGQPNVAGADFAIRGPQAPSHSTPISLEEIMPPSGEWQWVEVEGRVAFISQEADHLIFELDDSHRRIWVHMLSPEGLNTKTIGTNRIRITGLREGVWNSEGKKVIGNLWTADARDLEVVQSTNQVEAAPVAPVENQMLTTIAQVRQMNRDELLNSPRVKLRGVVIEAQGLFMQQEADGIELGQYDNEKQKFARKFGDYIEVEGRIIWQPKSGLKIALEKVEVLGKGELPAPARLSLTQMTSGKPIDRWVETTGVVRSTDGSHLLLMAEDGQIIATIRFAPASQVKKLVNATVRIRGVGVVATDGLAHVKGAQLIVPSLEYVEVISPAVDAFALEPRPIASLLMVTPSHDLTHRIKIEGTITLRQGANFFLQDGSGAAMAMAKQGVVLHELMDRTMHWSFLRTLDTNEIENGTSDLQIGDQVQVTGFLESGGDSPVLTEALFRKESQGALVRPAKTSVEEIFTGKTDSSLVSLDCLVLGREVLGADSVLQLEAGQEVFQAILTGNNQAFAGLLPGSRVRVTGVCQIEHSPYAELGKRVAAFKFLLRTSDDLLVIERPPWWNFKHSLVVGASLVFVLVLAGGWIRTLRLQVEERTKQLKKEIEEHKITESRLAEETRLVQAEIEEHKRTEAQLAEKTGLLENEIEERKQAQVEVERVHRELVMTSRLAGMAEVATGVLHNVGNVLNSVNVIASLIITHVQKSKVSSISKLASLLGEHRHDLGQFMTEDPNGKHIPGYVQRLASHLADEQAKLLEKVKSVTDNVQHIKEIVAVQQSYAKIGGVLEEVSLQEIVEDSLRMHCETLGRQGINVAREFESVPKVTVDRHKLLQILFNLLSNARYACEASGRTRKEVAVRLYKDGMRVGVSVTDNGIGISPENLPRIFTQGFTTREGGHGFGLHSSILAAQSIGGSLHVHSAGDGQGATFILEIPVAAKLATSKSDFNGNGAYDSCSH